MQTQRTQEQLETADAIYELKIGEGVEFTSGVYVERESPERFVIDGRTLCFIEAVDYANFGRCTQQTLCPDDMIRRCVRPAGHVGFCNGGVR